MIDKKNAVVLKITQRVEKGFSGTSCRILNMRDKVYSVFVNGKKHCLTGPATEIINEFGIITNKQYWIDNAAYSEEKVWQHPLVIQYKLDRILEQ